MDSHQLDLLRTIDPSELGARIRAARLAAGKRQGDLAGTDVTISYVSRIEAGLRKPDVGVLEMLAQRLGVQVNELLVGVTDESAEALRLAVNYAELALGTGDAAEALRRIDAIQADDAPHDPEVLRRAKYVRARAFEATGQLESAIDVLDSLLATEADGARAIAGGIVLCRCYRELGDNGRAISVGEGLVDQIKDWGLEDSDEAIQLTVTLAAAYFEHGDAHHAIRLCRRAAETADRAGSPRARASAYWNASVIEMEQGNLPTAVTLADRALAMLGEGNDDRNLSRLRSQLGIMQLLLDPPELDAAQKNMEAAAKGLAGTDGTEIDLLRNEVGLARAYFLRGDPLSARDLAARAYEAGIGRAPLLAADARALEGQALAAMDDLAGAKSAYRDAVLALTGAGADRRAAQLWLDLGGLLEGVGDHEASRDAYRSAAVSTGLRLTHVVSHVRPAGGISPHAGRTD